MQVGLFVTMKVKHMRQVLVQKKRGLFRCHDLEEGRLSSQRPSSLPAKAHGSYRDRKGRVFLSYPIILLAFGMLGSCPFISLAFGSLGPYWFTFLAFGGLSVKISSCTILVNGVLPSDPWLSTVVERRALWDPQSGSLEIPQWSVHLFMLDIVPAHLGGMLGVCGAPPDARMPVPSAQSPHGPSIQGGETLLLSDW